MSSADSYAFCLWEVYEARVLFLLEIARKKTANLKVLQVETDLFSYGNSVWKSQIYSRWCWILDSVAKESKLNFVYGTAAQ